MKAWFERYHLLVLIIILAFAFFTRVYRVYLPQEYVFDEVYHAVTAKLINQNDPRAYEWWNPPPEPNTAVDWLHPPLAKYTQALSMHFLGENSFGWRFSSVIFGVLVIFATYKLTQKLFNKPNLSLLAAGLASLDGLLLVQSRVAMNDIHVTFFILLTLITYLNYHQAKQLFIAGKQVSRAFLWSLAVGVVAGLAMGSKWSGMYVLASVWLFEAGSWLYTWVTKKAWQVRHLQLVFFSVLSLVLVPLVVYVFSYIHMFSLGHSLVCNQQASIEKTCYYEEFKWRDHTFFKGYVSHFVELEHQVWTYQTTLKATHPYQSRPWQWFLDARPVWYYVKDTGGNQIANIYAFGNPILFWLGDAAVLFTALYLIKAGKKIAKKTNVALLFVLLSYAMVWVPWMRSPRIMFFYHYTPAVPLLCILLAYWLFNMWQQKSYSQLKKSLVMTGLGLILLVFIVWYPQWTGISVPKDFADAIYYAVPSWK